MKLLPGRKTVPVEFGPCVRPVHSPEERDHIRATLAGLPEGSLYADYLRQRLSTLDPTDEGVGGAL